MNKQTFIRGSLVIVVCAAAAVALRFHLHSASAPVATPAPAVPVVTETIHGTDMPIVKTGLGTVVAYDTVAIHAQVTGTIQKIGFVEGESVQSGSLIAQLDPRPFQAALDQAQANLQRDQAHLENAQANLGRYVPLEKRGFATEQQVGDQTASVAEQQAAVAGDKAAINNAQTQLSYTTITSPIDGVTGILGVNVGNLVQPTDTTPIVTITQVQPIWVVFTLPQTDLPVVQSAMKDGQLSAIAYSQDGTSKLDTGTLLLVNNIVNAGSGTVQLKATFPNEDRALWPGEFVTVRLVLNTESNAVTVPLTALQQGQNGSFVFVVTKDNTVELRPVKIRETLDGRALIEQGLQVGETVVTAGQYRLNDGTTIVSVPSGSPQVQNITPATQGMLQ